MKNLLLLLLLANILYFLWGIFGQRTEPPGVAIVNESDLGPPLSIVRNPAIEGTASVGAVLGSGEPSDLAAVVGRSCVTIGPFKESADAETVIAQYVNNGIRASMRSTEGEIFVGHWVQVRNIQDRATGNEMLAKLRTGGIKDAYLVPTEDEGLKISLGLFGEIERAEKVELQAKSLGLPAEITARTREGTMFFVDVGLPPGRGAGAIIDQYGEEKVLLRGAASCPQ